MKVPTCRHPGCEDDCWWWSTGWWAPFCKDHSHIALDMNAGVDRERVEELRAAYLADGYAGILQVVGS